jgi:tricarballylate dehydrogenase
LGVEVKFESPVCASVGDIARIEGVRIGSQDRTYELRAKSVIACSGGFQANAEMRARYLSGATDFIKVRGTRHDAGEVTRWLLDLGANPSGQWQSGHMSPIDGNAPDYETPQHEDGQENTQSRYDDTKGITVNALGLLENARKATWRIWASFAPFDLKDALRELGYR